MAQHVVDALEAVQVQREHSHRYIVQPAGRQRLGHRVAKALAVGQAGQAVAIGQLERLRLLGGNVRAHPVEGARQAADVIAPVRLPHRCAVVTARNLLCAEQQRAQRQRQGLRRQPEGHGTQQQAGSGHGQQQPPQWVVGCQRGAYRAQQQHLDFARASNTSNRAVHAWRQHAGTRHQGFATGTLQFRDFAWCALQGQQRAGCQGADRHAPAAVRAAHAQRHVHAQQLADLAGQRLLERKTHQHLACRCQSWSRCCCCCVGLERHQHKLVRQATHHCHLADRAGGIRQCRQHLGQRWLQVAQTGRHAGGAQVQPGIKQRSNVCAGAVTVGFQHGFDAFLVAGRHCRTQARVGRQQRRALLQALGVLRQHTAPDVFVHLQRVRNLAARVALEHGAQHAKAGPLHHQQQQQ